LRAEVVFDNVFHPSSSTPAQGFPSPPVIQIFLAHGVTASSYKADNPMPEDDTEESDCYLDQLPPY